MQLSLNWGLLLERGLYLTMLPDTCTLPLAGLHCWASLGENVLSSAGPRCPRVLKRGFPFSEEKGRGQWGEGFVREGWGWGQDWDGK